MKSSNHKIIKSEEVRFIRASEKTASGKGQGISDTGSSRLTEPQAVGGVEKLKQTFAEKIRQVEQEAYQRGVSDGIGQGRDLQKNDAFHTLQAMSNIALEVSDLKKNILENAEAQIIQLVLDVAAKVIHTEVTTNQDIIRSVLKDAIKKIVDRENMKIRVHPQDFQHMMEIKSDFIQNFDGVKNIVFEEDDSIQRGGAIIESLFGEVDARLDQQYNEVKALMTTSFSSR
jgi:flagellar assembly protein FliH